MHGVRSSPGGAVQSNRMARPPITITCECGETKRVAYGQRWTCDAADGRGTRSRFRPRSTTASCAACGATRSKCSRLRRCSRRVLVPLIVFVSGRFIPWFPSAMAVWLFLFLPYWRRRYRRTARDAPRWELHPSRDADSSGAAARAKTSAASPPAPGVRSCSPPSTFRSPRRRPRSQWTPPSRAASRSSSSTSRRSSHALEPRRLRLHRTRGDLQHEFPSRPRSPTRSA